MISFNTNVKSFEDTNKALQEIKNQLSKLIERIEQSGHKDETESEGMPGDVRIIKFDNETSGFEIRTEEGWQKPVIGETAVSFQKINDASKIGAKKSIEQIKAIDDSTGASNAQKTILDESTGNFSVQHLTKSQTGGLMKPDYDSGWQTWTHDDHRVATSPGTRQPLRFQHGLETVPSLIMAYFAPGQATDAITWFSPIDNQAGENYSNGIGIYVDNTTAYVYGGDLKSLAGMIAPTSTNITTKATFTDGSIRVLLWK
tara:strand:- start:4358 stop:5131 length:774 start_codon:yes stop_codon:yes gene_type:complete